MKVAIYTLEALAAREKTTYKYVLTVIQRLKDKGEDMVWRDYKFVQPGGRAWFAIPKDSDIEFVDAAAQPDDVGE